MDNLPRAVAAKVRCEMSTRHVTQVDVAQLLEIPQSQVSRRLTGVVAFTLVDLERLAPYFDVTVAELLDPPASLVDEAPGVES